MEDEPTTIGPEVAERTESGMRGWRENFESRPWVYLGVAFTAGCVAAALLPAREGSGGSYYDVDEEDGTRGVKSTAGGSSALAGTWRKMQSAFVVAVTRQAEHFLEEMVPGFEEAYRERGAGTEATSGDAKSREDEVR
jgi:hypothetical protein